jgi:hypothetical protein
VFGSLTIGGKGEDASIRGGVEEAHAAPMLGEVHVDAPLGRPHPVVLGPPRNASVRLRGWCFGR